MKKILACLVSAISAFTLLGCKNNVYSEDDIFRIAKPWDKTGIRNHYHGGSNIGALEWFAVEPLIQYVRSTDETHYVLAEDVIHNADNTSIIKIRENAKWQNGDDFVAEDVMAFFHINFVEISNYLAKPLEKVDNKTVKLYWKPQFDLNDTIKDYLIAQYKVGSVKYSEFKEYVDEAMNILATQKDAPEGYMGNAPYGKLPDPENEEKYLSNYNSFKATNPEWFVATGPYKIEKVTQNQMILTKNEDYWNADAIEFEKILAYNTTDTNNIYTLLSNGEIDYQDGLAPEATLQSILDRNQNLAHLKMFDPGSIGILFNLERSIWTPEVREAFQYVFNREEVRNAGNKYGVVSNMPVVGMADSEVKAFLRADDYNKLPKYNEDLNKASELLESAGWKKINNVWTQGGNPVKLSLGYDGSHPGMSGVAEAVAAQLNSFGIDVVLKRADSFGAWLDNAKMIDGPYDFVVNWTGLNMTFNYPTGSFKYFYADIDGPILKLPKYEDVDYEQGLCEKEDVGQIKVKYETEDGETLEVKDVLANLYSYSETELQDVLYDMMKGASEEFYGVQFYQNVTGSFININLLDSLPLEAEIAKNRNVTLVPEVGTKDFYDVARTNFYFSQGINFSLGFYKPKKR